MADMVTEEWSDDEVFFGKMTLKEVKKHIWLNHRRNKTLDMTNQKQRPERNSIKIIETQSQPDLRSMPTSSLPTSGSIYDSRKSEESFIKMENLVSKLCLSPEKSIELNNTLDIVNYILNNAPTQSTSQIDIKDEKNNEYTSDQVDIKIEKIKEECSSENYNNIVINEIDKKIKNADQKMKVNEKNIITERGINIEKTYLDSTIKKDSPKKVVSTPKSNLKKTFKTPSKYFTPIKSPKKQADVFLTPSSNMLEPKKPVFKTPNNTLKIPSASSLRATSSKSSMCTDLKSPIATTIKKSIQVPMVSNQRNKKKLPVPKLSIESSRIPKLIKPQSKPNKENAALSTIAYKNAKYTKVVPVANKEKPSQVVEKLLSTLPQPPLIMKHEGRQFNSARKPLNHLTEDSIANVSCLQADLSVCTPVKPKY